MSENLSPLPTGTNTVTLKSGGRLGKKPRTDIWKSITTPDALTTEATSGRAHDIDR